MLPLIKPQQFLRKTGQSLLHCHFLSPVVFLCIWRIKQTHYILRAIQLIPFEIPQRYVKYIVVRKGRTNLCSDPLWTDGTTLYKVYPWQFNVLNMLPFTFKSLSRSSVIDRKPGFNKIVRCKYLVSGKWLIYDIKSSPYTHILTASTQIAANIKVMVIDVTSVIITILSWSSEIIKQHSTTELVTMTCTN